MPGGEWADLRHVDLRHVNLTNKDLHDADLRGADLWGANLQYVNLQGTYITSAKNVPFIPLRCPDTGAKCRCDKAIVLAIETLDGKLADIDAVSSGYDHTFIYKGGETVAVPDFCDNRFEECAPGIHFFVNRQETVNYAATR